MVDGIYRTSLSIFSWQTIVWAICIVLSIVVIHANCSSGVTDGYIGNICKNGIGVVDIFALLFFAPVYLFLLLIASGYVIKFW